MIETCNKSLVLLATAIFVALLIAPARSQVIIDDDFDAAEVSGWVSQGNGQLGTHTISQSDSVLSSEMAAIQRDTNRGIVSTTSFDPNATGGFTMTFVSTNVSHVPQANGYFIGLVRDDDVFHRDSTTKNFGLVFYGLDARTRSLGGFGLVHGDNNGAGSADFQIANSDAQGDVDRDSFFDGYSATVTVDPQGWSYEITGLLDTALTETVFTDTGTWADAGTTFEALWPAGQEWFVTAAIQHAEIVTHTIAFDRIALEGPASSGSGGPQITSFTRDQDAIAPTNTITWESLPNRNYGLFYTTDFVTWIEVDDSIASQGDSTTSEHSLLPLYSELVNAPELFYQVRPAE